MGQAEAEKLVRTRRRQIRLRGHRGDENRRGGRERGEFRGRKSWISASQAAGASRVTRGSEAAPRWRRRPRRQSVMSASRCSCAEITPNCWLTVPEIRSQQSEMGFIG